MSSAPLISPEVLEALTTVRRNASQTVASSFQNQPRDVLGGPVYARSNIQTQSLTTQFGYGSTASGNRSTAYGGYANAREDSTVALGIYTSCLGQSAIAIGDQAKASGYRSIAIGTLALATGNNGMSIGTTAFTGSNFSMAIGPGASTTGTLALAVGYSSRAAVGATAIGQSAVAGGSGCVSLGSNTLCGTVTQGIAIGENSGSLHNYSVAIGANAITTRANQFLIGSATAGAEQVVLTMARVSATIPNAASGVVTLSGAGTAIIYTNKILSNSQIVLSPMNSSGTAGSVYITTSTSGFSATVASTSAADTRDVHWFLVNPA